MGEGKDKLRKHHTKYLNVAGIIIIGSDNVPDNAFYRAKDIVLKVTSKHLQFRGDLSVTQLRLAPPRYCITHLPELREFLSLRYGFTNTLQGEVVTFCAAVVEWEGCSNMGVLTHELGHAIVPSIRRLDNDFDNLVSQAYNRAMTLRTWESWAEGVKLWTHDIGTGRQFETKDAFIEHDSGLARILDNWLHVGDVPYGY